MMLFKKQESAGELAEKIAVRYLRTQGLVLITQNYHPPGRGMADLDIVMQDREGTLVFVEVRLRSSSSFGGAAASISKAKQERLIRSALYFLMRLQTMPACRFDVIVFEDGENLTPLWLKHAFEVK